MVSLVVGSARNDKESGQLVLLQSDDEIKFMHVLSQFGGVVFNSNGIASGVEFDSVHTTSAS